MASDELQAIRARVQAATPEMDYGPIDLCPQCGYGCRSDEDGCCTMCGATLVTRKVEKDIVMRFGAEVERLTRERDNEKSAAIAVEGHALKLQRERDKAEAERDAALAVLRECLEYVPALDGPLLDRVLAVLESKSEPPK
jgi:hypothetical protein